MFISNTAANRETSIAVNPANNQDEFLCDPSGVPAYQTGQSYFWRTANKGRTWKYTSVETSSSDTRKDTFEGGDCDTAYDAAGTMYTADTWAGDLSIGASRDGGKSFYGTALSTPFPVVDRPWLVGGPAGTVYVSYHDLQCCMPAAMWFFKSTDYGKTFSTPTLVANASSDGGYIWEGNFVVRPNGKDIYLVYTHRESAGVNLSGVSQPYLIPMTVWVATSHDGGATFTTAKIASLPAETATIYPAIGLDAGGGLHVVWSQPREGDTPVMSTYSGDGGLSWSRPLALEHGRVGWAPWVVGGAHKGEAAVVWLGSPDGHADQNSKSAWFFGWARLQEVGGRTIVRTGYTTPDPIYVGPETKPEFEMVRLDKHGLMQIGMSVDQKIKGNIVWTVWSQSETATGH